MIRNISVTAVLQVINTVIPFLVIPYYVKVLGVDGYGQIGVALAAAQYLMLFVEFGFTLTAAKHLGSSKNKKDVASKLLADITTFKFGIMLLGGGGIYIASEILTINNAIHNLVSIGYLVVLGQLITPTWMFLGMEKSGTLLVLTIIPKILVVPFILYHVKTKEDLNAAMLLQSLTYILTGAFSIIYAVYKKWIYLEMPNKSRILKEIKKAWPLFTSSLAVSLTTSATPIILNLLSGAQAVGYFLMAEKIKQGVQSILTPVSMVTYPKIISKLNENSTEACALIRVVAKTIIIISAVLMIFILAAGDNLLEIVFGVAGKESELTLRILSVATACTFINTVLGVYILIPFGGEKLYGRIMVVSVALHLIAVFTLTSRYGHNGAAAAISITEFILTSLMLMILGSRNKILKKCKFKKSIIYDIYKS